MSKLVAVLALGAGLSSAHLQPAVSREGGNFNGAWSVELVTESGICDSRYSYSVSVQDGQVRLISSADRATMTGRVGTDERWGSMSRMAARAVRLPAGSTPVRAAAPGRFPRSARGAGRRGVRPRAPPRPSRVR